MRLILVLFLIFSFKSFAEIDTITCVDKKRCGLSLEEIAKRCTDPGTVNRQVPPKWVRVICKEKRIFWSQASDAEFALPGMGMGKVYVMTSKHDKAQKRWKMDVPSAQFSCLNLEQVMLKRAGESMMDCDEFLEIYENIMTYCSDMLSDIPGDIDPTGQVMTTCPKGKNIQN
jgi:hypothetical protein